MLEISKFNDVIVSSFEDIAPHKICAYVHDLSNAFNKFYHETKILSEDDKERQSSYINMISLAKRVLEQSIELLGFEAPERM